MKSSNSPHEDTTRNKSCDKISTSQHRNSSIFTFVHFLDDMVIVFSFYDNDITTQLEVLSHSNYSRRIIHKMWFNWIPHLYVKNFRTRQTNSKYTKKPKNDVGKVTTSRNREKHFCQCHTNSTADDDEVQLTRETLLTSSLNNFYISFHRSIRP